MEWLNYHHLLYFWLVAREGTIARACDILHVSQPTISTQISRLERSLGTKLFERDGRNLILTDAGRMVFSYADEIFKLGRDLQQAVKGHGQDRPLPLSIGVAEVLPKLIVYNLVRSALKLPEPVHLYCHEGHPDQLFADLAVHRLDVVLSDAPAGHSIKVRVFNHLLGECGVSFFASRDLARRISEGFPKSLDGEPFLMPTYNSALRRMLDQWLDSKDVLPLIRGEFEDSALMKCFGKGGEGVFAAPSVLEEDITQQYDVTVVGRTDAIRERFYAISVDRKLKHPGVVAITHAAKSSLFAQATV